MNRLSSSSENSVSTEEIVKRVKDGDFTDLENVISKLSQEEWEFLADFLVELYSEMDMTPLMNWLADRIVRAVNGCEEELAKGGGKTSGFNQVLRQRTIFGDISMKWWRKVNTQYIAEMKKAAAENVDITTVEGKERICEIVDVVIQELIESLPDSPIQMRASIARFHKLTSRGTSPLDPLVRMIMSAALPFVINPTHLSLVEEALSDKEKEICHEVGKIYKHIFEQYPIDDETYSTIITKYTDSLNAFIEEYYNEDSIEQYKRIVNSTIIYNQKKKDRAEKQLSDFLEALKDTFSASSAESLQERIIHEQKKELTDFLYDTHWFISKKEDGITYWKWKAEEDLIGIYIRMDGKVEGTLAEAMDHTVRCVFSENFSNHPNSTTIKLSENLSRYSFVRKFPFPFTSRLLSSNAFTCVEENEAFLHISNYNGEVPPNLIQVYMNNCGAYLRPSSDPKVQELSIVVQYDPKGNIPAWVQKKLQNAIKNKISAAFSKESKKH